jgi:DNA/RNA-binding domain of Phe-tRNA-synthetase-like protein
MELAKLTLNFFKLSKSKKEKIKIQAYKTAFNKFNPEKNKKKIENLYRNI